jgi:hypothetical protein
MSSTPISMTAASYVAFNRNSVCATPILLFRLPSVFSVRQRSRSTAVTISFVVVLPLLPVTATTGIENRARWAAASC